MKERSPTHGSLALYKRLMGWTRPYARGFVAALAGMILAAATEPVFPALMKYLLDNGFSGQATLPWWLAPAAIIGIFVVRGIATFTSGYALAWVATHVLKDLRRAMYDKMLRLPSSEFQREAAGQLISRIAFEIEGLRDATTRVLTVVIRDTLVVIGLLGWLMYLNWRLTLVALVLIPAMSVVVRVFSRRMRSLSDQNLRQYGELSHVVEESVQGYRVVKIHGAYAQQGERFRQAVERMRGVAMRISVASGLTTPVTQIVAAIAMSVVISIALAQAQSNQTTVGGFVSFVTAMLMLLAPLKHLADINGALQQGLAAAERVFELIDRDSEPDPGVRTIERAQGHLRFERVGFRYPGSEVAALKDIELDIKPGEMVAFVGGSGAGKTSLVNLVPRFFSPTTGRILLDDIPIETLTLDSLRAQIALVSQDVVLFDDTVRANVAFGLGGAVDDARIRAALADAALERTVDAMPGGLDAPVGDRGTRLSGGQRQRLALARALLKDAPILLLDEATSALDSETEALVQAALERTAANRTTLVVAHRLSTIERADRIVVMEHGCIVEQGRHADLLAAEGAYARLYRAQFREG